MQCTQIPFGHLQMVPGPGSVSMFRTQGSALLRSASVRVPSRCSPRPVLCPLGLLPSTPVFPRGPPPFPSAPRPPPMALLRAPAPSSAQPPRRARGSQRAGSGRPQLGSLTLSPGAGRREPVLRSSAARRRSRGINCTSSSNKTLKAAAGASSSRLCPDSLVRGSSRGPWGC